MTNDIFLVAPLVQVLVFADCPLLEEGCRQQVKLLRVMLHPEDATMDDLHAAVEESNRKPKTSTLISTLAASKLSKYIMKDLLERAAKSEEDKARSTVFAKLHKQVDDGGAKLAAGEAVTQAIAKELKDIMAKVRQALLAGGTWKPEEQTNLLSTLEEWMRCCGRSSLTAIIGMLTDLEDKGRDEATITDFTPLKQHLDLFEDLMAIQKLWWASHVPAISKMARRSQ